MRLATETVDLPGPMKGYLSRPAGVTESLPGVIVIQEIWGVDEHMRDVTDRIAAAGYVALSPDLFSRGGSRPPELSEPRMEATKHFLDLLPPASMGNLMDPAKRAVELERLPEAQRASVGETAGSLFNPQRFAMMPQFAQDLVAIAAWLRAHAAVGGKKIGAMGFCMGGGLAGALASLDPQLAASVIFYGQLPAAEAVAKISCPVLALIGEQDERLIAQVPAFEAAMKAAGKSLDLHVYPAAPHAYFNDTRASYRVSASRDSWARTLELFARTLV